MTRLPQDADTVNPVITFPFYYTPGDCGGERARDSLSSSLSLFFLDSFLLRARIMRFFPVRGRIFAAVAIATKAFSPDRGGPDLYVDYSQRSLTGSDPATNNLSQRRWAKYGNNNDNNKDFIITL